MRTTDVSAKNKNGESSRSYIADFKSLLKGKVLVLNVLPVIAGFWLALYYNDRSFADYWQLFVITFIGSLFVMAGALILNNWYDADIDAVMERTKHRPTVTGNMPLRKVLFGGLAVSVAGFILLSFTTVEVFIYSFIGWIVYVFLYTMWSKRRYTLNTVIGSVSGAVTPLIGWAAVDSAVHIVPITLFLIVFIWQMPHTFAIAIRKYEDYKAAGVAMLPVVHGMDITKRQMAVYSVCLLPLPFYLLSLGTAFIIIATLLNIGYIALAIRGFFVKDDEKWARIMFLYSVNYLMVLFLTMMLAAVPQFG
ncbi:heme o synthase [Virgibacillus kekensis]|uniref:Protoheme IX farnesyltransferase n=1 Tax=Virgibacillus kekensis TaxID=202261 RepID=A0ABV9DG04_9BACI